MAIFTRVATIRPIRSGHVKPTTITQHNEVLNIISINTSTRAAAFVATVDSYRRRPIEMEQWGVVVRNSTNIRVANRISTNTNSSSTQQHPLIRHPRLQEVTTNVG